MRLFLIAVFICLTTGLFAAEPAEILESMKADLLTKQKNLQAEKTTQERNLAELTVGIGQEINDYQKQIDDLSNKLQQINSINWSEYSKPASTNWTDLSEVTPEIVEP